MQADDCREHTGKPADPVRTSAGGMLEPPGEGETEADESRATHPEDRGEAAGDNWVSAQCSNVFDGNKLSVFISI